MTSPASPADAAAEGQSRPRPFGVRVGVLLPLSFGLLAVVQVLAQLTPGRPLLALAVGLASAAAVLVVYRLVVARLEVRPVSELRRDAFGGLVVGVVTGLTLMAATIGVLAAAGAYEIVARGGSGAVAGAVGAAGAVAAVAVAEEVVFRAVIFRLAEERLGTWGALVVSAVVFAALHLLNPHSTVVGAVALAAEAGALLAAAYVVTRALWLPIGIHLGWNWAEGALFGTVVSGSSEEAPRGLLRSVLQGPAALTGGEFGPEAGVPAVAVCVVATVVLLLVALRREQVRPRPDLSAGTHGLSGSGER